MPNRKTLSISSSIGGTGTLSVDAISHFSRKARIYRSNIEITIGGISRDAKDATAVNELKPTGGNVVTITASGEDCTQAANGLIKWLKEPQK